MRKWRIEDSVELYNVKGWGIDYFDINEKGSVTVTPKAGMPGIDLKELLDELHIRDVSMPVLLRFPDILGDRIAGINDCFEKASEEFGFKGKFYSVYPIKVNQVRPVVEELMSYGDQYNIGLEAGSKPELHAVLAIMNNPDALIICNGYKDEDFIELALLAQKMGRKVYIVVEKLNELKLIIKLAKKHKIRPNIGIRIKLASSGSGKWEESGGDQSKFGLMASELLEAISIAKDHNVLDCIKLIHFHLGSQITKIRKIKNALREAAQFYVQMWKMGCQVEFVDVGGGLGIDYDGSRASASSSSVNYSIQEYVNDSIFMFQDASDKNDLPHPNVIAESGRALTAHHSVLVFNVLEKTSLPIWRNDFKIDDNMNELVVELRDIHSLISTTTLLESWHDALQIREEVLDLFSLGMLDLETRALAEQLFWTIAREVYHLSVDIKHQPDEIRQFAKKLTDKYFCNFSLFQSLPDSWAIDQVFPIMPIHRLNEKPEHPASIQDITCDSDGKIDRFIGFGDDANRIMLHSLRDDEPYYLGVFLVGAYQEILGDLHNLFGDTNAVHVTVNNNGYEIKKIIDGETVDEVLGYVQYNSKSMVRSVEKWVASSMKEGKISSKEGKEFLDNYRSGLFGYTYLV